MTQIFINLLILEVMEFLSSILYEKSNNNGLKGLIIDLNDDIAKDY